MGNSAGELILSVYDTVTNPSLWPSVLDQFIHDIDARGSIIFSWEHSHGNRTLVAPAYSSSYDSDVMAMYLKRYPHYEINAQNFIQHYTKPEDALDIIDDSVVVDSPFSELNRRHTKILQKFGINGRAGGVLNKDNRWLSLLTVQLSVSSTSFSMAQRAQMAHVLPHFAKALDLGYPMRQLHHKYTTVLGAMDKLSIGICIVDQQGRIVVRNTEFERQQSQFPLLGTSHGNRLDVRDDTARAQLKTLMASPANHGRWGGRPRKEALNAASGGRLCVEVLPLERSEEFGNRPLKGFLICSTDTSLPVQYDTAALKQAFNLTDAETVLADFVALGMTNPEIAERRERSVATVNSQIKTILSKTRCANRTQFVRMLSRFSKITVKGAKPLQ